MIDIEDAVDGARAPTAGLKAMLAAKAVEAVLFIDDAFEPLSNFEPTPVEAEEIWERLVADGGLEEAGQSGINGAEELTADAIELLLQAEGIASGVLESTSYVRQHASKRLLLEFVVGYLREVGVDVRTTGRDGWETELPGVSIVFLDWRLGADDDPNAILEASNTAKRIHRSPDKPLIVLISSDPGVHASAQSFREKSGLIEGLFDAMPKDWLKDRQSVDLQFSALLALLRAGHVVQGLIDAIDQQVSGAIQSFADQMRGLSLSDYANLQHFALKKDGHPLGDYLASLCSGLLADLVFRGPLLKHLAEMDEQDFGSLPALTEPSRSLVDLYNSAVFDMHVGDFKEHPHSSQSEDDGRRRYKISFGDLVVEERDGTPTAAYIVMSPQCDLAASPRQKRTIPDEQTILLLPGILSGVDDPDRSKRRESADTPAFVLGDRRMRIQWAPSRMQAVPYGEFIAWVGSRRRRRARMRSLYALALQNATSQQLTRVGLPSPPPIYEATNIVLWPAFGGKLEDDAKKEYSQGRFVMTKDSDKDQLVLTKAFIVAVKDIVMERIQRLRDSTSTKDKAPLDAIESAIGEAASWAEMIMPFQMPMGKKHTSFLGGAVVVCDAANKPQASFDRKILAVIAVGLEEPAAEAEGGSDLK